MPTGPVTVVTVTVSLRTQPCVHQPLFVIRYLISLLVILQMAGQGSHSGGHPTVREEPDRVLEPGLLPSPNPLPCAVLPCSPPVSSTLPAPRDRKQAGVDL